VLPDPAEQIETRDPAQFQIEQHEVRQGKAPAIGERFLAREISLGLLDAAEHADGLDVRTLTAHSFDELGVRVVVFDGQDVKESPQPSGLEPRGFALLCG